MLLTTGPSLQTLKHLFMSMGLCTGVKCPQRPEKGIGSSGSGVTDSRGCWELNLGPLEEQGAFLTAEPSLQLLGAFLNKGERIHLPVSGWKAFGKCAGKFRLGSRS